MLRSITILILFFSNTTFTQNLLTNGSFEQHIPLSDKGEANFWHHSDFNKAIKSWQCNNKVFAYLTDTEDRYIEDKYLSQSNAISRCYTNTSFASKGTAYIALGFRGEKTEMDLTLCGTTTAIVNLYSTITSRLKEPLQRGKKYTLTFDIKDRKSRKNIPKAFGILLSTQKIPFSFSCEGIKQKPTFSFFKEELIADRWKNLAVTFVADSTFNYFTIGFFDRPDINTHDDAAILHLDNICLREEDALSCDEDKALTLKDELTEFNVYFTTSKSNVEPKYIKDLEYILKIWKKYPTSIIYVSGYTDNTGKNNEKLSQKRAFEIANYLKNLGVLENNIKIS